jgi:hypothetical protein
MGGLIILYNILSVLLNIRCLGLYVVEVSSEGVLMRLFPNLVLHLRYLGLLLAEVNTGCPENSLPCCPPQRLTLYLCVAEVSKFRNIRNMHLLVWTHLFCLGSDCELCSSCGGRNRSHTGGLHCRQNWKL